VGLAQSRIPVVIGFAPVHELAQIWLRQLHTTTSIQKCPPLLGLRQLSDWRKDWRKPAHMPLRQFLSPIGGEDWSGANELTHLTPQL
jgi:hypothetical protein